MVTNNAYSTPQDLSPMDTTLPHEEPIYYISFSLRFNPLHREISACYMRQVF